MIKYLNLINNRRVNLNTSHKDSNKIRKTPGLSHITQIDNYDIIYSPLAIRLYRLDKDEFIFFKKLPDRYIVKPNLKEFIESGLLAPDLLNFPLNFFLKRKHQEETKLTLFLTTDCNSACKYCYADKDKIVYLDFSLARRVIDKFIEDKKPKELSIDFHGGGEPTLAIDLIKKITEHLKAKRLKSNFNIQTDGVINDHTKRWLFKNMRSIAISCDGPPKIQNLQRPLRNNKPSSPYVEETIKFFVKNNYKNLFIHSLISSFSVDKMDRIIKYFYDLGVKGIGIGLLSRTKRSQRNKIYPPDLNKYIKNALKIIKFADEHKMWLRLELLPINEPRYHFCGALNAQVCLTPDGYLSSCYEALSRDSGIQDFIYGRFNKEENKFEYWHERLNHMEKRKIENIQECQNCYLKWACAGDCPVRSYKQTGSIFRPSKERCDAAKKLTKSYLIYKARKELIPGR